jgi:hypothetical protein
MSYADPVPARVTFAEWGSLFQQIPDELIQQYHYFEGMANDECRMTNGESSAAGGHSFYPWSTYLFPPQTFAIYGSRHLRRLKFDNSLAALRMWGFVMSETERLFRARQVGRQVIATMGDLGGTPPMVLAAGNTVPFYPDCIWWLPFLNESTVLFDAAAALGIGESACYSRAALGAFAKQSYFPPPALCVAATGASCDDYGAVEQLVADMGYPMHWFELPLRKDCAGGSAASRFQEFGRTAYGVDYQLAARDLLVAQFGGLRRRLETTLGREIAAAALSSSIRQVNRVRRKVAHIRDLVHSAPAAVFPALEMMVVEFGSLHFYSDIDEWESILTHIEQTVEQRRSGVGDRGSGVGESPLRVVWVTPPADPLLLCFAEDLGLRVVGTEYVINQALGAIAEDGEPMAALADALLNASLTGSSRARARSIIEQAHRYDAEGVVISGILGGSHCALETNLIRDYVAAETDLPVLAFDVPAPATGVSSQVKTRLEAFAELLRARR